MSVIKLELSNFHEKVLNNSGVVLVDFYADWCGPCKMVAPIVAEIAEERPDITVGKINVDDSPELAQQYGVMSIPTLIVFKEGKPVSQIVGYRPKESIVAMLGRENAKKQQPTEGLLFFLFVRKSRKSFRLSAMIGP